MIRKPPADWQREESSAVSAMRGAVDVAQGGVKVAKTGGHYLRGMICWAFALIWGFAALAAGLVGGSLPTFIGVGAMAAGMAWMGNRAFAKARGVNPTPPDTRQSVPARNPSAIISGSAIEYGQAQLVRSFLFYAIFGVAGLYLLPRFHGLLFLVAAIGVPCLLILAVGTIWKAGGDRVALSWDGNGLTVATLWRRRTFAWSDVVDIKVTAVSTYAFGFIRTARVETLGIHVRGGITGKTRWSILPNLLDFKGRTLADLVAGLRVAKAGGSAAFVRPAEDGPAVAPAVKASAGDGEFDPDAIMARYLAEREQQSSLQPSAERASSATSEASPQRPQFGRKGIP